MSLRCGIDTVELSRFERFLRETPQDDLERLFDEDELRESGTGAGRSASLAARFAAKEACCKLFPRETALGLICPSDFAVRRGGYGAPQVTPSTAARAVLDRSRIASIQVSLTHSESSASAIALGEPARIVAPWLGKALYYLLPVRRRVVLANLRRVFGKVLPETEIRSLAQANYAHFARLLLEFCRLPLLSKARRAALVEVENPESPIRAHEQGKGVLLLSGHFGNWEVSTVAGIAKFPQYRNLFHVLRRPLKPRFLDQLVTRRFRRAGLGTLPKRGSLEKILTLLAEGGVIVFPFDQHAGGKDEITVDFFGEPAGTFRSLAILALSTGAPVVPVASWRKPDGTHVLRFEEPLQPIDVEDTNEAIRLNTRAYNAALERLVLRHPEQWFCWMHRRWKPKPRDS